MSIRARISCVAKLDRQNPHERISHVGGLNPDGGRWRLSLAEAIAGVKAGRYSFFVENPPGHVADVVIARSVFGHEYLKTTRDGEHPNNLLSLPTCPP